MRRVIGESNTLDSEGPEESLCGEKMSGINTNVFCRDSSRGGLEW